MSSIEDDFKDLMKAVPPDIKDKLSLAATKMVALEFANHVLSAPVPDAIKLNALAIAVAAICKSAKPAAGIKTYGGATCTTPEEILDNLVSGARDMMKDMVVMDIPKGNFVMPETAGKLN